MGLPQPDRLARDRQDRVEVVLYRPAEPNQKETIRA